MLEFKILLIFVTISIIIINYVESSKILMVTPEPVMSHQKVYHEVWMRLLEEGHEVHLVTSMMFTNTTYLKNLVVYNMSDLAVKIFETFAKPEVLSEFTKKPSFTGMFVRQVVFSYLIHHLHEDTLKHEEVQRLLKTQKSFDACIVEWFYPTFAVFGHYFQCPLIGISSTGMLLPALDAVGNPAHPVLAPDQDLPLTRDMNFFERVWSGIWSIYVRIFYQLVTLPEEQKTIRKYFGDDVPPLSDMVANMSLLLINTNNILHRSVPNLPTVIQFGGRKKDELTFPSLSKDLEQFIGSSQHGVVLFSLGSGVQSEYLLPHIIKTFQDTFASLPFNFIWKWNGTMPNKPKNVLTMPWLPQKAILGHPNVKLFIYQGGLQSSEETIAAHKPVIGIPFCSDQTFNIDTCVKYGIGEMIALEELTVDKLSSLILKVTNNPSYTQNAEKLYKLIRDQPMDGLDKALWWIEYVIRHKGAHHLQSPAATMPLWKYLMLDVVLFVLAILYIAYKIVKCVFSRILGLLIYYRKKPKLD